MLKVLSYEKITRMCEQNDVIN